MIAVASGLVFAVSLWLIFSEKLNRTIAGIAGAAAMVGLGRLLGFYSEADAVQAGIDAAIAENGWTTVLATTALAPADDFAAYIPGVDAAGVDVPLYPEYVRIQIPKYGSTAGTVGYIISASGEVTKP